MSFNSGENNINFLELINLDKYLISNKLMFK